MSDKPVTDDGRTHWHDCWREHLDCAVAMVERALAELEAAEAERDAALREVEAHQVGLDEWKGYTIAAEAELAKVKEHLSTYYRAAVLEEAAKACDGLFADPAWNSDLRQGALSCGFAIRALAEKGEP